MILVTSGGRGKIKPPSFLALLLHPNKCVGIKVIETECVNLPRESRIFKIVLSLQENLNAMKQIVNDGILQNKDEKG